MLTLGMVYESLVRIQLDSTVLTQNSCSVKIANKLFLQKNRLLMRFSFLGYLEAHDCHFRCQIRIIKSKLVLSSF